MDQTTFNILRAELVKIAIVNGEYFSGKLNSTSGKIFKETLIKTQFNGFITLTEKLLALRLDIFERPHCECGNKLNWNSNLKIQLFCSPKCAAISTETKNKRSITNLEKYGVVHSASALVVRDKIDSTKIRKYGRKAANLGLSTPWNKGKGKLKYKLSKEELRARKQENYRKTANTRNAGRKRKTKEKYLKNIDHVEWTNGKFLTKKGKDYMSMQHVPCGTNIEVQLQTVRKHSWHASLCKTCHPTFRGVSAAEGEVFDFVKSIEPNVVRHSKLPSGLELDLLIPEKNIAIEYNGLYWHSEKANYPNMKHLNKTEECEKLGIKLIHLFEDEWMYKRDLVKSRLKVALGVQGNTLYARKLNVVELTPKVAREFLEVNHMQGYAQASIKLGLMLGDELISVMTFGKPRFNKGYDWELIRFATKSGVRVQGGASKLLSHFKRENPGSILSYADRRWSDGNLYKQLGFTKQGVSSPSYWYFKGDMRENRQTYQKAKLKDMPGFSLEKTESEIMFGAGWNRIWDCGNLVYALKAEV